ncbi:MAG: hypothetical protein V3V75_10145 [Thermoguttaceae bacterium]
MSLRLAVLAAASGMLLLAVTGCGGSSATTISGNVTYLDKPVENGSITFQPADGKGPSTGGTITGGSYRIDEITPGPKIVQILGFEDIPYAKSREEMEEQAKQNMPLLMATNIPDDAEGNNVTIEVKPGDQTRDFHLK